MKHTDQSTHKYPVSRSQPDFTYFSVLAAACTERAAHTRKGAARISKWLGRKLIAPFASMRRRQRAYQELTSLDDHTLADIGISRGDIPYLLKSCANQTDAGNDNGAQAA